MNLFIKEWPNRKATLMTDCGYVLCTFDSVEDAHIAYQEWCRENEDLTCLEDFHNQDITSATCAIY